MTADRCSEARLILLDSEGISSPDVAREYIEPQPDESIVFSLFSDRVALSLIVKAKVNPDDSIEVLANG